MRGTDLRLSILIPFSLLLSVSLAGCNSAQRRKSDAELGLNPQQATGRRIFDYHCARCHEAYSSRALQGPSLEAMYKKSYLPSGAPANDERVADSIRSGRSKMPAYGQTLSAEQVSELIAYLHTL